MVVKKSDLPYGKKTSKTSPTKQIQVLNIRVLKKWYRLAFLEQGGNNGSNSHPKTSSTYPPWN